MVLQVERPGPAIIIKIPLWPTNILSYFCATITIRFSYVLESPQRGYPHIKHLRLAVSPVHMFKESKFCV